MADGITLYDVLGVTGGASADTLRYAYDARMRQLRPGLAAGAPSVVVSAVSRAREAVEMSWLVLSDAERRHAYDAGIGLHQRGLRGSSGFAEGSYYDSGDASETIRAVEGALHGEALARVAALLLWIQPHYPGPRRRTVPVPDLRGLFYRACQAAVSLAGLRLEVVRLTPDPLPVEGLVVAQNPPPGMQVRRQSTLTVQVWHPSRPALG